ncbi:right-handed parallel beta-helix repeat-containing protein [Streptomyces coffeae]|uniref:Right-handed parallel beta-helix repeat-containing protein n=1 Tax=Streptomyces coffeae TaxID=621382 RepID=A0ABS1NJ56_9ACTN|nr:right-handed parallel beta-helix repeat-containing protein [Streptomyces coffeae]MBL1100152.1 right-handed parallel beta-helix repeat-containing protein [Streptomyces coffeae]
MTTPVDQWHPALPITAGRLNYMLARLSEMTTVKSFGALGDGAADDAPAIQLALNDARDSGGGWVIVPPGVYLLSSLPLRIYRNTRLTLLPGAEFRRNMAETMLINGDAGQNFGGYTGHSNITVEGGLWNMRGTTAGLTGSVMCISIGHCQDITIRDLEVRDLPGYHAVELNSTKRGAILNCRFRGYVDPGARDFSEAIQLDLAKSSGVFGGFGPYDHTPAEDILIQGCYFGASGTGGTTAWPRGVGSHSATITKFHRRIRVLGNTFESVLQYGVSAYNWEDVTVTGNTFSSCGSGVRIRSVIASDTEDTKDPSGTQTNASQSIKNFAVSSNTFRFGGGYDEPIVALGETTGQILNLSISGNSIDDSTANENGIRLQRAERFSVSGNTISNVSGTAISMEDCTNGNVTGNEIYAPGSHGITSVTTTHTSLNANSIMYPANNGILVQDGSDIQVKNNYIKSPGRQTNNTWYGIRISTNASSIHLTGNKTRPNGSGNEAINGLSVSNTCTNIARSGNDWRGTQFTGGALADSSTSPATSATDLT